MSRHDPPNQIHTDARILQRLSDLERRLVQVEGNDGFYQVGGGNLNNAPLGVQIGRTTLAFTTPASAQEIALPVAWKKEHLAFVVCLHALSKLGTWITQNGPFTTGGVASLSVGSVWVETPENQNVEVTYVSFGR